jgi:SagB-type dehydrogenase family enzyme
MTPAANPADWMRRTALGQGLAVIHARDNMSGSILAATLVPLVVLVAVAALPLTARSAAETWVLPEPRLASSTSLEEALATRRSVRSFSTEVPADAEIGQLLWAAQGVTDETGKRTSPSAGALYPLELYLVTAQGLWRYEPAEHALTRLGDTDLRGPLRRAALDQEPVGSAPLVVVVTGVVERTAAKYGDRAPRYVLLEAGHATHGLLLQAVALDLAAVPIGAFDDAEVALVLGLPAGESPIYLIPVGYPD